MRKIVLSLSTTLLINTVAQAKELRKMDDITVIAQKIEENPRDVPIAMNIYDEFKIEDNNIQDIADLSDYTSGMYLFQLNDNGTATPTIRGIASDYRTDLASVPLYIDGVATYSTVGYNTYLYDIERIEVLKGPQSTLYGKNAEAGVINIITKKPNNETRSKVGIEIGEDNKRKIDFGISGPIVENKFFIGLSGRYFEKDGYIKNTYLNKNVNDKETLSGRLNLRYLVNDDLELSLITALERKRDGGTNLTRVTNNDPYNIDMDFEEPQETDTTTFALKIDYNLDEYSSIEAITSYRNFDYYTIDDFDKTANPIYKQHAFTSIEMENISQEVRYKIQKDKYNYIFGLFVDQGDKENVFDFDTSMGRSTYTDQLNDNKSYGVFGHFDYKLTDKLSFLAGLRYDKDTREFENKLSMMKQKKSFSEISPKIAMKYQVDEDMMTYATIAKGYKPGGFFVYAPSGYEYYDQETLISYEVGVKSSFFDDKLNLNSAVYYIDISNKQVNVPISAATNYMKNAQSATSKGFELEATYVFTDEVTLFSSFSYNKATFDDFKYTSLQLDQNWQVVGTQNVNNSGKYIPYTPKYTYGLGTQYRGNNGIYANVTVNGYGSFYSDDSNTYKRDSYALVDTKIGYETKDYDIYLYGKNIFDKDYSIKGQYGAEYVTISEPRELGVQFIYRF